MRTTGAVLILLSAATYLLSAFRQRQKQEKLVQDILDAIEQIATLIRWENRPLPDSIERQTQRGSAGRYFEKVMQYLKSGMPLQTTWNQVFSAIKPEEVSTILCGVLLSGDSAFLQARLSNAAEQIRAFQRKTREIQRERQKLQTALTLSGAGLVVILLL